MNTRQIQNLSQAHSTNSSGNYTFIAPNQRTLLNGFGLSKPLGGLVSQHGLVANSTTSALRRFQELQAQSEQKEAQKIRESEKVLQKYLKNTDPDAKFAMRMMNRLKRKQAQEEALSRGQIVLSKKQIKKQMKKMQKIEAEVRAEMQRREKEKET